VWDGTSDADSCPKSGSARLSYYGFAFGQLSQCLNLGAGAYRFGYRFKQQALGYDDGVYCEVDAYSGTGCDTTKSPLSSMMYRSGPASTNWMSPSLSTTFVAPSGTGSLYVLCGLNGLTDSWIDQVYLSTNSGSY
jgi:hypothetical protein